MVGNEKLWALQSAALRQNWRLNYLGDERQLQAIDAGHPFYLLQRAGLEMSYLGEMKRQHTAELQSLVHHLARNDLASAFKELKPFCVEVADKAPRLAAVVNAYQAIPPAAREQVLIITPANEDRVLVNEGIRAVLAVEGQLSGPSLRLDKWVPKNLTLAETCFVADFRRGDILRFTQPMPTLRLAKDSYVQVDAVDEKTGALTVYPLTEQRRITWRPQDSMAILRNKQEDEGESVANPGQHRSLVEVYQRETITLQAGDKIRWTRTEQQKKRLGTGVSRVLAVDEKAGCVTVREESGQLHVLSRGEAFDGHIDYAYCGTTHNAQGKSGFAHVIVLLESFRQKLTHQRELWVAISRVSQYLTIITDNLKALERKVMRDTGDKASALAVLNSAPTQVDVRKKEQENLIKPSLLREQEKQAITSKSDKTTVKQVGKLLKPSAIK